MTRLIAICITSFALLSCATTSKTSYKLKDYEKIKLENGLNLILVPDKSLPYFSISALVKSGATYDPQTKSGLANIVANLLDKGTEKRSAKEIADSIEQVGGVFGAEADLDYTMVSASGLSFHRRSLLQDYFEVLMQPKFSEEDIDRFKKRIITSLYRTVDDPPSFSSKIFSSYLYGSHPYGKSVLGKISDVKSIKRKDILNYYTTHYRPNNMTVAVVGDYDEKVISDIIAKFNSWKPQQQPALVYPQVPVQKGVNIKLVHKDDLAQTQIRLGSRGIKRTDKDFLELRLASTILGGTFSSRLMKKIRIEKGLTYNISSSFDARKDFGPFTIATFTRHDKVGESVQETLAVVEDFYKNGVTDEELKSAKALLKGVFPRALETAERLAMNLLILDFYEISDSYLKNYYRNIDRISKSDVNRAIRAHINPKDLKVLIYSKKDVLPQIRDIGIVELDSYKSHIQ